MAFDGPLGWLLPPPLVWCGTFPVTHLLHLLHFLSFALHCAVEVWRVRAGEGNWLGAAPLVW